MQRIISIAVLVSILCGGSAFAQVNSSIGGMPGAGATISINSTSGGDFGYLTNAKTGTRTFQGQLRLTF
jgi:hypothetical protein